MIPLNQKLLEGIIDNTALLGNDVEKIKQEIKKIIINQNILDKKLNKIIELLERKSD